MQSLLFVKQKADYFFTVRCKEETEKDRRANSSPSCKEKIIPWLEEKASGKWGEPAG